MPLRILALGLAVASIASATPVLEKRASVTGIDGSFIDQAFPGEAVLTTCSVSHYQGTINWNTVKANGVQFVYIKATEGTSK